MTQVKCSVDSCHFWENNVCRAEAVAIENNRGTSSYMEVASLGDFSASTSAETQCRTFRPRKKK